MQDLLTFSELRAANVARDNAMWPGEASWTENDWAVAVAGEVGEMCNLLKKRKRGDLVMDADIAKEMADAVTYLDLLANKLGIDLGKSVRDKFNEVSDRNQSPVKLDQPGLLLKFAGLALAVGLDGSGTKDELQLAVRNFLKNVPAELLSTAAATPMQF